MFEGLRDETVKYLLREEATLEECLALLTPDQFLLYLDHLKNNHQEREALAWKRMPSEQSTVISGGAFSIDEFGHIRTITAEQHHLEKIGSDSRLGNRSTFSSIEYRQVASSSERLSDPTVLIGGNIHPDETSTPRIWHESVSGAMETSRLEVMNVYSSADRVNRRLNVRPLSEVELKYFKAMVMSSGLTIITQGLGADEITQAYNERLKRSAKTRFKERNIPYKKAVQLQKVLEKIAKLSRSNNEEDKKKVGKLYEEHKNELLEVASSGKSYEDGTTLHLGKTINLNRSFLLNSTDRGWTDFIKDGSQPEVRLMYEVLARNKQLEIVFTLHEDVEWKGNEHKTDVGGFYFYRQYGRVKDLDPEYEKLFEEIKNSFLNKVKAAGISLHQGIDDMDEKLQLEAQAGYIDQPLIDAEGNWLGDDTFEAAAVFSGMNNLTNIQEAFCFEIPGGLPVKRKKLLLEIIRDEFMNPLIQMRKEYAAKKIDAERVRN